MTRNNRHALQVLLALASIAVVLWMVYRDTRPTLRLYIWADYLPPSVIARFEFEHQVRIEQTFYRNNDEMLARVKLSWGEYDVIMPSNYVVEEMRRRDLLLRLTRADIPNLANLDPAFFAGPTTVEVAAARAAQEKAARETAAAAAGVTLPPTPAFSVGVKVDPVAAPAVSAAGVYPIGYRDNAEYAIPYLLNFAGIAHRTASSVPKPTSWADLLDLERAAVLGPRLAFLDEQRETLGLALLALGYSPNTQDAKELEKLRTTLLAFKAATGDGPRFVLANGRSELIDGKLDILATWSPEITAAQKATDPGDIDYTLPKEGAILTFDTLAIPRSSSQPELAKKFINYLLSVHTAGLVSQNSFYATSLDPAKLTVPEDLRGTPSQARPPGPPILLEDLGEAQHIYDAIWSEFRPRKDIERDRIIEQKRSAELIQEITWWRSLWDEGRARLRISRKGT
ncbi:MAG TPA: spermidine/putrescine ABC transporter substrate-binding protein [Opitutaceae bacterium]